MGLRMLAIALGALALAGCGAGDDATAPVTLTLQMPNRDDPMGHAFARAVAARSGGTVRVRIGGDRRYDSRWPAGELRLARALRAGREDIGYLPARAWAAEGLPAFEALLAPFAITTHAAARAVATGAVARRVLATLPPSVVGLALVPSEPRRIIARRPPTSPAAFRGLRLRVVDNPQTEADLRALGAVPVRGLANDAVNAWAARGRLDGAETSPTFAAANNYVVTVRHLSSYALAPKFQSIVLSARAWRSLSVRQRAALRDAARTAVAMAARVVPADEQRMLDLLCSGGARIARPSPAQLRALVAAARPATRRLGPEGRAVLAAVRRLPGTGPRLNASRLPPSCRTGPAVAER